MSTVDLGEFVELSDSRCRVGKAKDKLDAAEAALLEQALMDDTGRITPAGIFQWCKNRGLEVSEPAVRSHLQKRCGCFR